MSNLKNGRSGSSVIISKINLHLSSCRRRHAEVTADRISPLLRTFTRSRCRGERGRALSTPGNTFPAINSSRRRCHSRFSPSALLRHQLAPPLTVASIEQHLSCPATPTPSPRPCASLRLACATWVGRSRPAQLLLPRARPELRHHCLDMARPFQTISAFTKPTHVTVVSH